MVVHTKEWSGGGPHQGSGVEVVHTKGVEWGWSTPREWSGGGPHQGSGVVVVHTKGVEWCVDHHSTPSGVEVWTTAKGVEWRCGPPQKGVEWRCGPPPREWSGGRPHQGSGVVVVHTKGVEWW